MAADPVAAWCGRDERQTSHHLFVNCEAWRPQIQELWKGENVPPRGGEEEWEGGRGKGNPGGTKAEVEGEEGGPGYS